MMERLTLPHYGGDGHYMKCSERMACDGNCGECDDLDKIVDRLAYYEDMEEQGRLVVLPCKVGDTVYVDVRTLPYHYLHPADGCRDFARCEIVSCVTTKKGTYLKLRALYPSRACRRDYLRYAVSAIGKTVFLTREEVEQALAADKNVGSKNGGAE